ncbi:MAG: AAA family ATPase [Desulfamplus sp.]|nr:AAA family ATPase [Desulfamplus sp.]
MRLIKARVQNYRSIIDTGLFDIENLKTILVGPNEAGKTAILQALQKLSENDKDKFDPLRDYPRSKYNDITTGKVKIENILVVEGHFQLDDHEIEDIPEGFKDVIYVYKKHLDNKTYQELIGGKTQPQFSAISNEVKRMIAHIENRIAANLPINAQSTVDSLKDYIKDFKDTSIITKEKSTEIQKLINALFSFIEEGNKTEENRPQKIATILEIIDERQKTLKICSDSVPVLILFSNIFRVKPLIYLQHLADRVDSNVLDDKYYDYGNLCLLKLLGFTPRELSNLGKTTEPQANNAQSIQAYRDQLDKRSYQLNAASVKLTNEIRRVWNPNPEKVEADKLRVVADGQYLKVVVEDDLGVEIELDQRSEGFQWLVSFFVVFFAEAEGKHANAILLLVEPGLSLHGLKQREFQKTISRLAEKNQIIFTTHSPFLVGANELDIVRVVEMISRDEGTKVHTSITASDSAALLPLQEALGYDLAATLFMHQKNLILEGLTDYWYLQGLAELLKEAGIITLDEKIALLPASSASKIVYFATILHSNKLKVAALLDSDVAGEQAAQQAKLVNSLGNKNIIRTKDVYSGSVSKTEIEDILRNTLVEVAKTQLEWDVQTLANSQVSRPIVDIFTSEISGFSKYRLAKAFLKWVEANKASQLKTEEIESAKKLIDKINKSLK